MGSDASNDSTVDWLAGLPDVLFSVENSRQWPLAPGFVSIMPFGGNLVFNLAHGSDDAAPAGLAFGVTCKDDDNLVASGRFNRFGQAVVVQPEAGSLYRLRFVHCVRDLLDISILAAIGDLRSQHALAAAAESPELDGDHRRLAAALSERLAAAVADKPAAEPAERDAPQPPEPSAAAAPTTFGWQADVETRLAGKLGPERVEQCLGILGSMAETDRLVALDHYIKGVPLREIADELGESLDSVRQRTVRVLEKLAPILGREPPSGSEK
jgi:DNA-directed RNA polymerase specialized sigma24 family protein